MHRRQDQPREDAKGPLLRNSLEHAVRGATPLPRVAVVHRAHEYLPDLITAACLCHISESLDLVSIAKDCDYAVDLAAADLHRTASA